MDDGTVTETSIYDPETSGETKLDRNLIPRIFDPSAKLGILTGHAGDGQTAFSQHVEKSAADRKAKVSKRTDNGCPFNLNGSAYQIISGGSQDFEGTAPPFGSASSTRWKGKAPESDFTKSMAIN